MPDASTYFIRDDYRPRRDGARSLSTISQAVLRQDEFELASYLAGRLGRSRRLLLDAPTAESLLCGGARTATESLSTADCQRTLVVCPEVFEKVQDPGELARFLEGTVTRGLVAVLTTADREAAYESEGHRGPPGDEQNLREWSLPEFRDFLSWAGLPTDFVGRIARSDRKPAKDRIVAILDSSARLPASPAPHDFTVRALMASYNEADIIQSTIAYLASQGVETHLLDNWSTDGTFELAAEMRGRGLVTLERFPPGGDAGIFTYRGILSRVEELARKTAADWIIRHDVDERRSSPWQGVTIRDALFHIDALGFNSIDHTVLDFRPVSESFQSDLDIEECMEYFSFGKKPGSFVQVKGWKRTDQALHLAGSAGHGVRFKGQRVFPYKFLLKHYPIRSQEHGLRKVAKDRVPRWDPASRAIGWHTHYDHVRPGHNFIHDPGELLRFQECFFDDFLVERLSGVGVLRVGSEARA